MRRVLILVLLAAASVWPAWGQLVPQVRAAANSRDFARSEQLIAAYRATQGVTPEMILALSWMARGAQSGEDWERAEKYAAETRQLALELLKKRPLDADETLPLALGASIEVQAHTLTARNARAEAVTFLERELLRWRATSIRTRIQKNLHLLSLAGKPAPALDWTTSIGPAPTQPNGWKGQASILFFWAHWCGDCKQQKVALAQLQREYSGRGLVIIGPTQRYGYVAGGADATADQELGYIGEVREKFYGDLQMTVPVSEENFKAWGASSTPTVVVVDRAGIVRLYHPGRIAYEKLAPIVAEAVRSN